MYRENQIVADGTYEVLWYPVRPFPLKPITFVVKCSSFQSFSNAFCLTDVQVTAGELGQYKVYLLVLRLPSDL